MAGVVSKLRDLVPLKPLTPAQALVVTEHQATTLLKLSGVKTPPVPDSIICDLPRIQVERVALGPVSGATEWSHGRWLILVNGSEPPGRQRFSLAHEFKHVLDNPFINVLYPGEGRRHDERRAEQLCDHFAACLLMPRKWLVALWKDGVRDPRLLARRFQVSPTAMNVRLRAIGLNGPRPGNRHRRWPASSSR